MGWLQKLFRRDSEPPTPPSQEPSTQINPYPAETAVHWSAEDQQSGEDVPESDEPKP
jgi:hypothetical protein